MKVIAFLAVLAVSCHAASDDQSLMQQAVGFGNSAAQRASATEIQGALQGIHERIGKIGFPGKMRQMAIDALMKSVSTADKIDDNTKGILGEIVTLLNDILAELKTQNVEDQKELNETVENANNCNNWLVDVTEEKHDDMNGTRTTHATCRTEEEDVFDADAEACQALEAWMNSRPTLDCQPGISAQISAIADWDRLMTQGSTHFTELNKEWAAVRDACETTTGLLEAKRLECKQAQNNYENKHCAWRLAWQEMCSHRTSCHGAEVTRHDARTLAVAPLAARRVQEARVIEHIVCLLEKLKDGVTDRQPCEDQTAADEERYQTDYNITHVDTPAMTDCDPTVTVPYPGHVGWFAFLSDKHHQNTPPESDTGIACADFQR